MKLLEFWGILVSCLYRLNQIFPQALFLKRPSPLTPRQHLEVLTLLYVQLDPPPTALLHYFFQTINNLSPRNMCIKHLQDWSSGRLSDFQHFQQNDYVFCIIFHSYFLTGLGMENIGGIFVVLICGLIVAIFMAMLEFLWTLRHSEATEVNLQRVWSVVLVDGAKFDGPMRLQVISDKICEIPQKGGVTRN